MSSQTVYLIDGARTPFSHHLRQISTSDEFLPYSKLDLGLLVARALLLRQTFSALQLDDVVVASNTSAHNADLAQQLARRLQCKPSLIPHTFSAGENCVIQALQYAHQQISFQQKSLILIAGIETAISKPIVLNHSLSQWISEWQNAKSLIAKLNIINKLHSRHFYTKTANKGTEDLVNLYQEMAEKTASYFSISTAAMAEYIKLSHRRLKYAQRNKLLKNVIPVFYPDGSSLYRDEDILDTDPEALAQTILTGHPATGIITKASITQATDGACVLLLANQEIVNQYNLTPLAQLSEPNLSNKDNVVEQILKTKNIPASDIDYWEWDEVSAAEVLSLEKKPQFETIEAFQSLSHVNVDGGSLVLGNPNSANKLRCILQLASILQRNNANNGICHFTLANGQRTALLVQINREDKK